MKDTKYNILITIVLILNLVALYVLNFVSFDKKDLKQLKKSDFLLKLSKLDEDFDDIDFAIKIKPAKVVVVETPPIQKTKTIAEVKPAIKKVSKVPVVNKVQPSYVKTTKVANSDDIYERLKKKFKDTNDYKIALKLSRLYYVSRKYKSSLKWAMIANELNEKDDGSWILFAKSKLKLGEKDLAKKALLTYSNTYDSKRVKKLLNRIDL